MNVVEANSLRVAYRTGFWKNKIKVALEDLSLSVGPNEVLGLLGPNGAGKTTTIKCIVGLTAPNSGAVRLFDMPATEPEARKRLGFLPEQPYFYDHLTARELLSYYAQLSGLANASTHITRALERVRLDDSPTPLRKYSKGMLQRLGIAQAILHDPELVVLDEPMSGLDPVGRREVRELIQQFKAEGRAVLFSTHVLSDAEAICDRVAVIAQGKLRGVATVSELLATTHGVMEIIWQGSAKLITPLGIQAITAGDTSSAQVAEADLPRVLDLLRAANTRLISINPVRGTVEDYFIETVNRSRSDAPRDSA